MNSFDSPESPPQAPAPKVEEDLSWLRDLEASSKQTGDLAKPQQDAGWTPNIQAPSSSVQPPSAPDDLSWLNDLGGISAPIQPASSQPSAPKEDLNWLDDLGRSSEPSQPQPSKPSAPKEDLSWLNNLGGTSEPLPPTTPQPSAPKEDLSWLQNLGEPSEPEPSTPTQSTQSAPSTPSFDTFKSGQSIHLERRSKLASEPGRTIRTCAVHACSIHPLHPLKLSLKIHHPPRAKIWIGFRILVKNRNRYQPPQLPPFLNQLRQLRMSQTG